MQWIDCKLVTTGKNESFKWNFLKYKHNKFQQKYKKYILKLLSHFYRLHLNENI